MLGVKASVQDVREMALLGADFLETILFASDMKDWNTTAGGFRDGWEGPFSVHAPEYHITGRGKDLVDPVAPDPVRREEAKNTLAGTMELARKLDAMCVLVHPGGIRPSGSDDPLPEMNDLLETFNSLERYGIPLYLENMPWFYWMDDGLRFESSFCTEPDDLKDALGSVDGILLDTCHAQLARKEGDPGVLMDFLKLEDLIRYVHLSDAIPPDGEGLLPGKGVVPWDDVIGGIRATGAPVLPEIMDGHRNGGEKFALALEWLKENGMN